MDLPVTPTGRQFLDIDLYQVMNVAMGLKHPVDDLDAIKLFISSSIMLKIPRFSSLLVKHVDHGREYFRPTRVDVDKHIIIVDVHRNKNSSSSRSTDNIDENEDVVNGYLADLAVSGPLSLDKPLWEVHVLVDVRCLVLRVHHAICDGMTLLSVIKEMGIIIDTGNGTATAAATSTGSTSTARGNKINIGWWKRNKLLGYLAYFWFSLVFCTELVLMLFFLEDKKTVLNTTNMYTGDEYHHDQEKMTMPKLRPQLLATARFSFDDFNVVRKAIPNATINDVLTGILWGGLIRYIDTRSTTGTVREGQQITGVAMVNLRKQRGLQDVSKALNSCTGSNKSRSSWLGNNTSAMLVPLHYTTKVVDPLDYVRKSKSIMDNKKHSWEPRFLVTIRAIVIKTCGLKLVNYLTKSGSRHATFGISNVVGPSKEILVAGNPVSYIRMSLCTSPMNIVMHMVSYMKNLDLQILVARDVVPDPKFLAQCFKETLQAMKDSAYRETRVNLDL